MFNDYIIKNKAFTIIELIIVLTIIVALLGVSIFVGDSVLENSRDTSRKAQLQKTKDVIDAYALENATLPNHKGCLNATVFPELVKYIKNGDFSVDPIKTNEIKINNTGICGGKNEFYYIPLTKNGLLKSFILVADTEKNHISEKNYISSGNGSRLQAIYNAGTGDYDYIMVDVNA